MSEQSKAESGDGLTMAGILAIQQDEYEAKIDALTKALKSFVDRFNENGEWDEGCFYYFGTVASEFQTPLKLAAAALSSHTEQEGGGRG